MSNIEDPRKQIGNERLVSLLRSIDLETAQTDEDHVADDESLLEKWSAGLLTGDEHEMILSHLAACHECSQFFHDMTRAGVFQSSGFAHESEKIISEASVVREPLLIQQDQKLQYGQRPSLETRGKSWIVVATAACALLAVAGYMATNSTGGRLLLAQGDFGRLTHYLNEAEFAMVAAGSFAKAGGIPGPVRTDASRDQELNRLKKRIAENPSDMTPRLNYGQLLLEAGRPHESIQEFQVAAERAPENHFALLGLGLAQFRAKQIADAEVTFARIPEGSRLAVTARLNQILCLIALDRKDQARLMWQQVPKESQTEQIRRVLEAGTLPE
jgi:tetratricopeptide (TPR) repeat protein